MFAVGAEFITDLDSKLAGWRQDQGARSASCFVGVVVIAVFDIVTGVAGGTFVTTWPQQFLKNGQRKSRSLTSTCLGNTQNITFQQEALEWLAPGLELGLSGLCQSTHAVSDRPNRVPKIY